MKERVWNFFSSDEGVTSIEYAIIASVMVLALMVALPSLSTKVQGLYGTVASNIP